MTWKWSKAPVCKFTDIVGMTTGGNFYKISAVGYVNYYKKSFGKTYKTKVKRQVATKNAGRGTYFYVPMTKGGKGYAWSGTMTTKWEYEGKRNKVGISSNYGHAIFLGSTSISFSSSGIGISFSPERTIKSGMDAYERAKK